MLPIHFPVVFCQMYKVDDTANRYVSPLILPDGEFHVFPTTVVNVAGMDSLRDEGLLLEEKFREQGELNISIAYHNHQIAGKSSRSRLCIYLSLEKAKDLSRTSARVHEYSAIEI